jgi:2-polyprenyl-6-methoxyphenol hydroxylase-like FAD-dependent oxidoreductase
MQIIIVGAGIGGLTTAISLSTKGFDVQVYESVNDIKPLGVGINLLPHAVRVLTNLGLGESLARVAVATSELAYYNKFGQKIWQEPRGKFAGYNWPQYSIHRGVFQMLLLETAKEMIGENNIHTGFHLLSCKNNRNTVTASFMNRKTNKTITKEAGALVGADGIHSIVRKQFYPNEGAPEFSGIILHRGTARSKPFLTGSSMIMAGSVRQKFVAYPISPGVDENGHQLINWIADLPVPDDDTQKERDWNRSVDKEKILPKFNDWNFNWLNVPGLIDAATVIYEFPMSDRDPLKRWSFERITLLGDAAHPMYPIGSNGGSQAILDSECITESLVNEPDIVKAFQQYEQERLPATSKIVLQNRQMGPEQVMQIVEERAPGGFDNLHDIISQKELEDIAARYKRIAGFEKEILNQKQ